jgi:Tfp pilus assembly protein PilO
MNSDRLWIIGAVAGMIVVALAGWFVGISPIVAQASAADATVASTMANNAASESKLASLKTQFAGIDKLQKTLDSLRESIPEGADASVFLQELNTLSAEYNVALTSVTINAATIYQAATPTAPTTSGSTATSTPTPSPTPTTPAAATTPATVVPTGGLVIVPVQITVTGAFDDVKSFVGALQSGARLYLATSVEIGSSSGVFTGSITGDIFTVAGISTPTKSDTPTPIPIPTPTPTPTPTGTPTPGVTSTPTPTLTPSP